MRTPQEIEQAIALLERAYNDIANVIELNPTERMIHLNIIRSEQSVLEWVLVRPMSDATKRFDVFIDEAKVELRKLN